MDINSSHPESREALLETLALRLAASPYDPRPQNLQLLVGQLPDALPFEVPIPPGSRVIGTLARSATYSDVVLDVPLPPEQALAFYREHLQAAGWATPEQTMPWMGHGGFVHSSILALKHTMLFCKGPDGPSLDFKALAEQGGFTDVRLSLDLDERESPCAQAARMQRQNRRQMIGEQLVPPLIAPAGAQQMGGGSGGGSDTWHSEATLEADGDLATIAAHYAGQLEKANWTQTAAGNAGPIAWHTWTFKDAENEPWRAVFFIFKTPGLEKAHFLSIKADRENKPDGRRVVSSIHIGRMR